MPRCCVYIPTVHADAMRQSECTLKPLNRSADFELYLPLGFPGRSLNSPNGWNTGVGPVLTLQVHSVVKVRGPGG